METKSTTPAPSSAGQVLAASKKIFTRSDKEPPYPTYMNAIEFSGLGVDLFMDVGVVSPESIQAGMQAATSDPAAPVTIETLVLYRFAMTIQTAMQMHQRLTELIANTRNQLESAVKTIDTKEGG
jgi:hypothetical protein